MPDCRAELIADSSAGHNPASTLIGDTCHIVARKPEGPRGSSIFSEADRNRYSNLILLCRNHHAIVDQDPDAWPIELLHKIKADHELWVEEKLSLTAQSQSNRRYTDLVEQATEHLCLKSWDGLSDHAVRGFLFDEFVQGSRVFGTTVFRYVWPGEKPELEDAIRNAARHVSAFVNHFLSRAQLLEGKPIWAEDTDWKRTIWPQHQYRIHLDQTKRWQKESIGYLCNVVVALNHFADSVRKHLQSDYFVTEGRFTVYDSMGVTTDMEAERYVPTDYVRIDDD